MEVVTHAVALGLEVSVVVFRGWHLDRHVLDDFQSVGLQSHALLRVVGHEAHLVHAKVAEHLRAAAIVALVGFESEVSVGIDGVVALLLLEACRRQSCSSVRCRAPPAACR